MAASTATQPPERASMVCDGSSHGRAASLTAGNEQRGQRNELTMNFSCGSPQLTD